MNYPQSTLRETKKFTLHLLGIQISVLVSVKLVEQLFCRHLVDFQVRGEQCNQFLSRVLRLVDVLERGGYQLLEFMRINLAVVIFVEDRVNCFKFLIRNIDSQLLSENIYFWDWRKLKKNYMIMIEGDETSNKLPAES